MTANAIWAIARNTIRQAIRVRIAFVIMAVYLALVPLLPFVLKGDGTLRGLLHVVISYSLMVAGALLGILTLALSTTTLWSELREKQIYLIESRPVHRWEVLLGKLAGILALNAALLAFMALVTWACVEILMRRPQWDSQQRAGAYQRVLVGRRVFHADPPELNEERIDAEYERRKAAGELPANKTEDQIKKGLREEAVNVVNGLGPGRSRVWRFRGLPTTLGPKANVTLRYKFYSSERAEAPVRTLWCIGKYKDPKAVLVYASRMAKELHEDNIPASTIGKDGVLEIICRNDDPRYLTIVFTEDAVQVLVPVSGFVTNLARGLAILFVEILFLAILGLFCSTFMGFPVSPIVAVCLLLVIYLAGILHTEIAKEGPLLGEDRKLTISERYVRSMTGAVRLVLPPLDRYAPSSLVSSGEHVSWLLLLRAFAEIGLLRGGILFLLGIWVFERREIAGASR